MKILALDIGDRWTGSAISDPLGIFARPYRTVATPDLDSFLSEVIQNENIKIIVVGYPKTLRGTESEQTKKIKAHKLELEKKFSTVSWEMWDERLTSKMASKTPSRRKKASKSAKKNKAEKLRSHSIAAAFILDLYLSYLQNQKNMQV